MKKLKVILPMLAIIFAIGLTFASVSPKTDLNVQANDYIQVGGSWVAIPEQTCEEGEFTCRVQDGDNGPYEVYDEMNDDEPKSSASPDPNPIEL